MKNRLIIRLIPNRTDQVQWLLQSTVNAQGKIVQQTEWASLPPASSYHDAVLIIPGTHVALKSLSIPPLSPKKLTKAIPYLIEEACAESINNLHITLINNGKNKQGNVTVISKTLLRQWLKLLSEQGIKVSAIIPETLLLPLHGQDWTLFVEADMAFLQLSNYQGITIELDLLPELINQLLTQVNNTTLTQNKKTSIVSPINKPTIHFYTSMKANYQPILDKIHTKIALHALDTPLLPLLANNLALRSQPANLLQGEFQATQGPTTRNWVVSFFLIGALLISMYALKITEHRHLKQSLADTNESTLFDYRKIFPDATNLGSAQVQVSQRLDELQLANQPNTFLNLLAFAGLSLENTTGIRLLALNFTQQELGLQIDSNSAARLDSIANQLQQRGATIKEQSVTSQGDEIIGSITIAAEETL